MPSRRHNRRKQKLLLIFIVTLSLLGLAISLYQTIFLRQNQQLPHANNDSAVTKKNNSYDQDKKNMINPAYKLNQIIIDIINLCKKSELPTNDISITLIDLTTGERADYQGKQLRYPASVVKVFWLFLSVEKIEELDEKISIEYSIEKMIKQSDNDSSGYVVDWLTGTKSGGDLASQEFQEWRQKRKSLNEFFVKRNNKVYSEIDISQKTYPLPKQKLFKPEGRELQLRGGNIEKPIRNQVSTDQAAFLMEEIITNEKYRDAKKLLTIDLENFDWRDPNINYFNPIKAHFGESLPTNIEFISKAGWTSQTRQEIAYIATKDNTTKYILAIFAEAPSYSKDENIFPEISKMVFNSMSKE